MSEITQDPLVAAPGSELCQQLLRLEPTRGWGWDWCCGGGGECPLPRGGALLYLLLHPHCTWLWAPPSSRRGKSAATSYPTLAACQAPPSVPSLNPPFEPPRICRWETLAREVKPLHPQKPVTLGCLVPKSGLSDCVDNSVKQSCPRSEPISPRGDSKGGWGRAQVTQMCPRLVRSVISAVPVHAGETASHTEPARHAPGHLGTPDPWPTVLLPPHQRLRGERQGGLSCFLPCSPRAGCPGPRRANATGQPSGRLPLPAGAQPGTAAYTRTPPGT